MKTSNRVDPTENQAPLSVAKARSLSLPSFSIVISGLNIGKSHGIEVVLENLNSLIREELGLLWGIEREMEKLSSLLSTIQDVLEDAEEKQLKDKVLRNWLLKLNSAAYEADDILDDCTTEASQLQSKHQTFIKRLLINPAGNVLFRHKIGKRMKAVIEKLNAIAEERIKFHLREIGDRMPVKVDETRETGSILTQSSIFGRDQDKERIIEWLVDETREGEHVSVLPILGMGGLGKTTLAQMVFNEERVAQHFDLRLWVCVTSDFDVKRVVKEILESATRNGSGALKLDPLQRSLQDLLSEKRFLLVLDDVWNEDQDKWQRLKDVLACGSTGSFIIVTTRLEKVAIIAGTLPTYCLLGLSEEDSWLLFKQHAFGQEPKEEARLEKIGREIVAKCGGVPLATKALGGFMRFKKEESEWLFVKESEIWNLPQGETFILPALRLSYHNLPFEMRRCFAYCSVFHKSTEIKKEKLIHLWMANGFVLSRGNLEMEDVGNEVWNELYMRSFFHDVRKNDFGDVTFKMHDLIHDLAHSVMEGSRSSQQILLRDHYLSLPPVTTTLILEDPSKFSRLRVLDASRQWGSFTEVPSVIGSLKHLRYLNLSFTEIQTLPDTICDLWNLQILNLDYCWELQSLPKRICSLKNLRHLCLLDCPLIGMPPSIGQLTCLKTLNKFVVGKQRGFKISELQDLNLRGTLHITNLEKVKSSEDAKEANLEGKKDLRHLSLSWDSEEGTSNAENHDIVKYLVPPSQLQSLRIHGFRGTSFPFWMSSPIMKDVVDISLENCENCVNLPPFGELPLLKSLRLEGLPIEYVDNELQGEGLIRMRFPSLTSLNMNDLPKLRKLSRQEGQELFPHLRNLDISNCPLFMSVPENLLNNLNHLESLYISCLETLQMLPTSLSSLTHLQYLYISCCPNLVSLPQSIQRMGSLKILLITGCPELQRRYDKGNGEHWHYIAHIPEVCITP
nr:putative disease resistance protein RGA3 [Ipomoea batatas]